MTVLRRSRERLAGFTLVEVMATLGVLGLLMTGIVSAVLGIQRSFVQNQVVSDLNLRAQRAMDRVAAMVSQAITADVEYGPLRPTTGVNSHLLRFRLIQSVDTTTGLAVYEDTLKVYVYGPDTGTEPCQGLVIGRGPDLATIHSSCSGPDGLLGTSDDDTSVTMSGTPMVTLLLTDRYAPETGDMFTINVDTSSSMRLVTLTLRLNARGSDGGFLLPADLVLTERVALRQ